MSRNFSQLGYITNDIDRAMSDFRTLFEIPKFKTMRDLTFETLGDKCGRAHFALAFKGDIQYEIIQPLGGDVAFYAHAVPAEGYGVRFHHYGTHFASRSDFYAAMANARDRGWTIPMLSESFGGAYGYADARQDIGHFYEYLCFPRMVF
jgi:hypothetical protein